MPKSSNSFFGWLGRQVGSVKGAICKDVAPKQQVVYQKTTVHETPLPDRPDEKLRRTVIDEVVRDAKQLEDREP
ncbi:MAG TPA: hypothetical protein VER17_02085 [Tepidisphaeraceae bacterium]|nr:hypothetical protein [Tepidisphaeraceae bacterium]